MMLVKDKNGDYIPSPTPASEKKVRMDTRQEGLYDPPWEDVDTVISSILKSKMEASRSKSNASAGKNIINKVITGKKEYSQSRLEESTRSNIKRLQAQHHRQTSLPDQK